MRFHNMKKDKIAAIIWPYVKDYKDVQFLLIKKYPFLEEHFLRLSRGELIFSLDNSPTLEEREEYMSNLAEANAIAIKLKIEEAPTETCISCSRLVYYLFLDNRCSICTTVAEDHKKW